MKASESRESATCAAQELLPEPAGPAMATGAPCATSALVSNLQRSVSGVSTKRPCIAHSQLHSMSMPE